MVLILFFGLTGFSVSEDKISKIYFSEVVATLTQNAQSRFFTGKNGRKIHYYHYSVANPRGVIVISPGKGEPAIKYAEIVYDLKNTGYDMFVIDHRGQGLSDRVIEDTTKSHVEDFGFYIDDLENLITNFVKPQNYLKSALIAHSMGGPIVVGFLERNPKLFNKVVLVAPMMKIDTKPYPELIALNYARALDVLGKSNEYAPTQKPYDPSEKFEANTETQSRIRFELNKELEKKNPEIILGGTTVHWVRTNLEWTGRLRRKKNVLQVPTLIIQASKDEWVKPEGQTATCDASPKMCQIQVIEGAKHEIFNETDIYRDLGLQMIREFLGL